MGHGTTPKRVLFVCWGNICRSPAAEGILSARVVDAGLHDEIVIDSAGTIAYHQGERADPRMREAAARRGYTLESRSRPMTIDDFAVFDRIVAMDRKNLRDIEALAGDQPIDRVRLLSSYLPDDPRDDVPDPYYGDGDGFEVVLDMLEAAAPAIIDDLVTS